MAGLRPLGELVDVREATALFRLPYALDGFLTGFPTFRPSDGARITDTGVGPQLQLGHQLISGTLHPVSVPVASLTSHALIVGSTGSGKTSSVLQLLEPLWAEHQIPFLVIEPVNSERNDYRWLLERPGFEKMLVLTVGDENLAPLRLNPFEVPLGVRVGTHISSLVSCFDAAFGLIGPLPFLYRKALRQVYSQRQISVDEVSGPRHSGRWPSLPDLVQVFSAMEEIDRYSGEVRDNISAMTRLRAESLMAGACGRTLATSTSLPFADLLDRPVVLELAAVGDDEREQTLMIALLLNALTGYYKATRTSSALAHVTVIEEAHRLLRRPQPSNAEGGDQAGRAAEQFAHTLAENRKYGEGLIIVEQVPAKLIEDAHKNTALKIMHHLPAEDDRGAIAATMNMSADQELHARSLAPMQAFVTHRGLAGRAGLVQVPNIRGEAASLKGLVEDPLPDSTVVRERFLNFMADQPKVWSNLLPFKECGGCQSRCQFRDISLVRAPMNANGVRKKFSRDAFPVESGEQEKLWQEYVTEYQDQAGEFSEFTGQARLDLAGCLFMHAAFAAFPEGSVGSIVRRFRRGLVGE